MLEWQDALCKVIGAFPCSPTERRRAFQHLHDTGIAAKIGGKIAETTLAMVGEKPNDAAR